MPISITAAFIMEPDLFPLLASDGANGGLVSMWRIELLHPTVIHFPIVLTLVGTLFWVTAASERWWAPLGHFDWPSVILLLMSVVFAWAAYQTGLWADDEVGRRLYDPRLLQTHQNYATKFAWLLSVSVGVDLLRRLPLWPKWISVSVGWLAGILLLGCCVLIVYVGHLGASLVYQQGAGVTMPGS